MKTNHRPILFAGMVGLMAALSSFAQTPGGHDSRGAILPPGSVTQPDVPQAVRSVFKNYFKIQAKLADDSKKNVSATAQFLAATVRGDATKTLPEKIAQQADTLANAQSLDKARQAFKPLSESLIAHLKSHSAPAGTYYEVYCPIVKASWLQVGEMVRNPYLGLRSATPTWGWACFGEVKEKFIVFAGGD